MEVPGYAAAVELWEHGADLGDLRRVDGATARAAAAAIAAAGGGRGFVEVPSDGEEADEGDGEELGDVDGCFGLGHFGGLWEKDLVQESVWVGNVWPRPFVAGLCSCSRDNGCLGGGPDWAVEGMLGHGAYHTSVAMFQSMK